VTEDWDAVAAAIERRLTDLGVQLQTVAERSKVSESTIRELRYNTHERKRSVRTLESLSVALEWKPDHLNEVLAGTSMSDDHPTDIGRLQERVESLDNTVDQLVAGLEENNRLIRQVIAKLDHWSRDRDVP
jgi:chromosome segregation ATPase